MRSVAVPTAAIAAATMLLGAIDANAVRQPNFLFIITDDQDRDLGSFSVMPNAQKIFNGGLNFSSAYVASPICCPSRTALFSGRQPHNIGDVTLGWCGNFSAQRENTFTTSLSQVGYRIGQFGAYSSRVHLIYTLRAAGLTPVVGLDHGVLRHRA